MNKVDVHKGIINWFRMEPGSEKKASTLRTVCVNLLKANDRSLDLNYRYELLYPLLKLGVIEYYTDYYKLAPSCVLQKRSSLLFCNIPKAVLNHGNLPALFDSGLGVEVYKNSEDVKLGLQKEGVAIQHFKLAKLLHGISLPDIIENWSIAKVLDMRRFYILNENSEWSQSKEFHPGVYKTGSEVYAQRLLMISERNWRRISNNWNDLAIAALWSKIQNSHPLNLSYSKKQCLFSVGKEHFPLVIERLLLLNSLLEGRYVTNLTQRQYYLSGDEFTLLNKVFYNRISVI